MKSWFIIGGSFRSGTTLMRLCLDSHPSVHVFDEHVAYGILERKGPLRAQVFHDESIEHVGFKVPVKSQDVATQIEEWSDRFGSAPGFVWMQRDLLQIVASMKRTWGDSATARFENNVKQWRKKAKFKTRYKNQLLAFDALTDPAEIKIGYATLLALYKQDAHKDLPNPHLVDYESLVKTPEITLRDTLSYLDIPWHEQVLKHDEVEHTEPNVGGTSPKRPIDERSVDLWKTRLSESEIAVVKKIRGDKDV